MPSAEAGRLIEAVEMCAELVAVVLVSELDRGILNAEAYLLDLAVGPKVIDLG